MLLCQIIFVRERVNHFYLQLFLYITDLTEHHVFLSNGKIEVLVQNFIQGIAIPFMYFILQAWIWSSAIETCYQIKDIKLTNCVNGSLFLMLLYLT